MAGAQEGGAFLHEFLNAGFTSATLIRTGRNARTKHPRTLFAEVVAVR